MKKGEGREVNSECVLQYLILKRMCPLSAILLKSYIYIKTDLLKQNFTLLKYKSKNDHSHDEDSHDPSSNHCYPAGTLGGGVGDGSEVGREGGRDVIYGMVVDILFIVVVVRINDVVVVLDVADASI